jgi:hypothetical protein
MNFFRSNAAAGGTYGGLLSTFWWLRDLTGPYWDFFRKILLKKTSKEFRFETLGYWSLSTGSFLIFNIDPTQSFGYHIYYYDLVVPTSTIYWYLLQEWVILVLLFLS